MVGAGIIVTLSPDAFTVAKTKGADAAKCEKAQRAPRRAAEAEAPAKTKPKKQRRISRKELAALAAGVAHDLQAEALPELTAVANDLGMTCLLAVLDGHRIELAPDFEWECVNHLQEYGPEHLPVSITKRG